MLRAGPLSDERIVRLINRRFVPFYFDLSVRGAAGDKAAREFVVKAKPVLGGGSVPTPPLLIMNAEGQVLAETSNYATEAQVMEALRRVLTGHPEYAEPSEREKSAERTPLERAEALFDLGADGRIEEALAGSDEPEAHLLRARVCRFAGEYEAMERHLAKCRGPEWAPDVRMERAQGAWGQAEFDAMMPLLREFPNSHPRYTEARYLEGLAQYHRGKQEEAKAIWRATITGCSQDPWIYRADWAFTQLAQGGGRRGFSTTGPKISLLGRIGYMGRSNPDLEPRG